MPSGTSAADLESQQLDAHSPTTTHPEEMKGTVTFGISNWISVTATGRATPAGLISAALLACAILIPTLMGMRRRA